MIESYVTDISFGEVKAMKRLFARALTVSVLSLSAMGCGPGSLWSGKTDAAGSGPPYMGTVILIVVCLIVYFAVQAWKKKDRKK